MVKITSCAQGDVLLNYTGSVPHIFWRLLKKCNYNCDYCLTSGGDHSCIFARCRLFAIANKITQFTCANIIFCGGEPTFHPFLPDIIQYLLYFSPKFSITVETNGSRTIGVYKNLLNKIAKGSLKFSINIHPAEANIEHILAVIGMFSENGYDVHLNLHVNSGDFNKIQKIYASLVSFYDIFPFSFAAISVNNDPNLKSWTEHANAELGAKSDIKLGGGKSTHIPSLLWADTVLKQIQIGQEFFCCPRSNVIRIEPDGSHYDSICPKAIPQLPLWKRESSFRIKPEVIPCCETGCAGSAIRFSNRKEGEEFVCSNTTYKAVQGRTDETLGAKMARARYHCLSVEYFSSSNQQSQFIDDVKWQDIGRVYEAIGTTRGKELFVFGIACLKHGRKDLAANERFRANYAVGLDSSSQSRSLSGVALKTPLTLASLQSLLPQLKRHKYDLHTLIEARYESWVSIPLTILDAVPGYVFEPAYDEDGSVWLHACHPDGKHAFLSPVMEATEFLADHAEASQKLVKERLDQLQLIRETVQSIDPSTTAIITFREILPEAVAFVRKLNLETMPPFIAVDVVNDPDNALSELRQQLNVAIFPVNERYGLPQKDYCLYSTLTSVHSHAHGLDRLVHLCIWQGLNAKLNIFAASLSQLSSRPANPQFVQNRLKDIARIDHTPLSIP